MDLTHSSFDHKVDIVAPDDLGALMIDLSIRQEASPTAIVQSGLVQAGPGATGPKAVMAAVGPGLLTPHHGAFNPRVATRLTRWKDR